MKILIFRGYIYAEQSLLTALSGFIPILTEPTFFSMFSAIRRPVIQLFIEIILREICVLLKYSISFRFSRASLNLKPRNKGSALDRNTMSRHITQYLPKWSYEYVGLIFSRPILLSRFVLLCHYSSCFRFLILT